MQITNTDQALLNEKENMATQIPIALRSIYIYLGCQKNIPHNWLRNKVLNCPNNLISMILVLPYQNNYRLRRVTEICKGRAFCGDRTVFTKRNSKISISHSKLSLSLLYSKALSLSLLIHSPSLSSICPSHLLLTLQIPWHCSDFSVHGIVAPWNLFKSKERVQMTLPSFHLILTQTSVHLCTSIWKFTFCAEHSRYH